MTQQEPFQNGAAGRMSPAEFKTLRESVGLQVPDMATLADVSERMVRYWESGRHAVPEDVARRLEELDRIISASAEMAVQQITEVAAEHGVPDNLCLVRYRDDETLWRFHPTLKPYPSRVHAALLARTRMLLRLIGFTAQITYFDEAAYAAWLAGRSDSPALRSKWLERDVLQPTVLPAAMPIA